GAILVIAAEAAEREAAVEGGTRELAASAFPDVARPQPDGDVALRRQRVEQRHDTRVHLECRRPPQLLVEQPDVVVERRRRQRRRHRKAEALETGPDDT